MPARPLVLLPASLCAAGLAALAYFHDSDLVLLREHLNHPFAFAALACLLMAWAAAVGLRRRWLRVLIVVLAALGAAGALFVGMIALAFTSTKEAGFVDGPDAVMWLSVRRDAGPLSKEWDLACFNDDNPDDAFDSVTWTGPSSVEIRVADGRTFPITLDPASERPQTTAAIGC
ncbi:hypothetical protein SAMN05444920_11294 [Nonomuraea solani]|uniref:Uncharacterized protein n=1 Tax=Nonomuraea solani TaxID=1144553 RepID=A0A1H6EPE1_9ACTN|nr:hypothetical protein [Nonomuraea solani]SEG98886.1 hypothetical protein SAMN05444920_11294 [Nonomuraea solani]